MPVTSSLILHHLEPFGAISGIAPQDYREYLFPCLLLPSAGDLSCNCLYIASLEDAMSLLQEHPDKKYHFVCTVSGDIDAAAHLRNIILVPAELSQEELLWNLQCFFSEINDWENALKTSVLGGCSYQRLFDLSEPIMQCTIVAVGPGFSLVAKTNNTTTDDPLMNQIIQNGFHSHETQEKFRKGGLLNTYSQTTDVVITDAGVYSKYATAGSWLRWRGKAMLGITAICQSQHFPDYLLDLFRILLSALAYCFDREQRLAPVKEARYESLIRLLAHGDFISEDNIKERAKAVGIPFSGFFRLFNMHVGSNNEFLLERIKSDVSDAFPRALTTYFDCVFLVINPFPSYEDSMENTYLNALQSISEMYEMPCGISRPFLSLTEVHEACRETTVAVEMGEKLYYAQKGGITSDIENKLLQIPSHPFVFLFDDIALFLLAKAGLNNNTLAFSLDPYLQALERLLCLDDKKGIDYYYILLTYLTMERKTTECARALNMHRTRLQYHLEQIQSVIRLSLDSPQNRMGFLMAYRANVLIESE